MVKRSRVLAEAESEADLPYDQTRLARRAIGARKRVAGLLALGAAGALLPALLAGQPAWAVATIALSGAAWGVHRARLGALVAAALIALVALGLGLRLVVVGGLDTMGWIGAAATIALAAAALPDLVTLVRDAELQHAYGLWARRG